MKTNSKQVVYIRDNAFFECDCGADVGLTKFGNNLYEGRCIKCGIGWELKNNQFREVLNETKSRSDSGGK